MAVNLLISFQTYFTATNLCRSLKVVFVSLLFFVHLPFPRPSPIPYLQLFIQFLSETTKVQTPRHPGRTVVMAQTRLNFNSLKCRVGAYKRAINIISS